MDSSDATEAVMARCLHEANETLAWDEVLATWSAEDAGTARMVLDHPNLGVRPANAPVPPELEGTTAGDIFSAFVRMSDGELHRRRKVAVTSALERLTTDQIVEATRRALDSGDRTLTLHDLQFHVPVVAVGVLLGVPLSRSNDLVKWTGAFVRAAAGGVSEPDIACLVTLLTNDRVFASVDEHDLAPRERVANAIGLLFQTHDATAGLIGNAMVALIPDSDADLDTVLRDVVQKDVPVRNTRRFAHADSMIDGVRVREGEVIVVQLVSENPERSYAFGYGAHGCPGEHIALAIAREVIAFALRNGMVPDYMDEDIAYHPSTNARIPDFRSALLREKQP